MTGIMYPPRRCETHRRYIMTRQFKKLAHSLYECKYHIVFCPKYHYQILQAEVAYMWRNRYTTYVVKKMAPKWSKLKFKPSMSIWWSQFRPSTRCRSLWAFWRANWPCSYLTVFRTYENDTGANMCGRAANVWVRWAWMKSGSKSMSNGSVEKMLRPMRPKVNCLTS